MHWIKLILFTDCTVSVPKKKKKKTTKIISYKATGNKKARKFLINNKSDIKKKREINYSEKPLLLTREGYASGPTTL